GDRKQTELTSACRTAQKGNHGPRTVARMPILLRTGGGVVVYVYFAAPATFVPLHSFPSTKSTGQQPRTRGPPDPHCPKTSAFVQPASSSASARIGMRSKARSS